MLDQNQLETSILFPVLFGGGSATFSPADIAGLEIWLKADAGTFQDSAKTTAAASDGDVVGAWADQSENVNDALQATTANKPLLKLNIVNGRPVIRFDGTNDLLSATNNITDGTITVFCVLKKRIVDAGLIAYGRVQKIIFNARAAGTDEWGVTLVGGQSSSGQAVNVFTIITTVVRAADDIDLVTNGNVVTVVPVGGYANNVTNIGANIAGSAHLDGDIAEFLIYDTPLSDKDRQLVENYLNGRYAIF